MRRHLFFRSAALALALVGVLRGQGANESRGLAVPAAVARLISPPYRELEDRIAQLKAEVVKLPAAPKSETSARLGWKLFGYEDAMPPVQWVEVDLGAAYRIDAVVLVPADPSKEEGSESGFGFPRRFRVEAEDAHGALHVIADRTADDFPHPRTLPVYLPAPQMEARRVRVTMTKPWKRNIYSAYTLGEIMILAGNRNLAAGLRGVTVRTSDSLESPPAWSKQNLIDGQTVVGAPLVKSTAPGIVHGWESARFRSAATTSWVQVDLGASQAFDEVRILPVRVTDFSESRGYGFPRQMWVEVAEDAAFSTARTLTEWTEAGSGNPAFNPITVPGDGAPARYVRVSATQLWQRRLDTYIFALAELQVYRGDRNVALHAPVTVDSSFRTANRRFAPEFLTDGLRGISRFVEWPEWLAGLSRRREIQREIARNETALMALQPALLRTVGGMASAGLGLAIASALVALYRARLAQARAVAALQRQIAGDLHDEIGSNLASIAMLAELNQEQAPPGANRDVGEIRRLASESAAAMRDLVWLIQPGPHDAPRLVERLRSAARRLLGNLDWQFEIAGLHQAPSLDVQRHLLLALKEMLHNVVRHAGARRVEIRLMVHGDRFTLEVRDDGCGCDVAGRGDGHGFTSLRHRAELLDGQLAFESRVGQGTRVALDGCLRPSTSVP